jgi:hypothetical protein
MICEQNKTRLDLYEHMESQIVRLLGEFHLPNVLALGDEIRRLRAQLVTVTPCYDHPGFCPFCGKAWQLVRPGKSQPMCQCQEAKP